MKAKRKRNDRIGTLIFIIPIVVLVGVIGYGFIQYNQPGALGILAYTHDKYAGSGQDVAAQVSVTLGTGSANTQYTTPTTLSLGAGGYSVSYAPMNGYVTPAVKAVVVTRGQTIYATGVYEVVPEFIQYSNNGFNSTQVQAYHAVTPVVWINTSDSSLVLTIANFKSLSLQAGQNVTEVFPLPGSFTYSVGTNVTGTVQVL